MAQKTEKEETELKVPETLSLCVNNCGFTGSPATENMCQKCFSASAAGILQSQHEFSCADGSGAPISVRRSELATSGAAVAAAEDGLYVAAAADPDRASVADAGPAVARKEVHRCSGCGRKVGLIGFRCRCGELFCAKHRYSDRHDCCYDYKSAGREAIARENPVVRAAKIVRV